MSNSAQHLARAAASGAPTNLPSPSVIGWDGGVSSARKTVQTEPGATKGA